MTDLQTARRTGVTTLGLGLLDVTVALYKATGDSKKETGWESRLVDAKTGKPLKEDPAAANFETGDGQKITAEALMRGAVPVQGDPLGATEDYNERAAEALDEAEDAARAWGDPNPELTAKRDEVAAIPPPEGPELVRQRGFETARGFVPADEELEAIEEHTHLDRVGVVAFVRAEQVARSRTLGAYYLAPEGDKVERATSLRTLDMLKGALQRTSRFALVKFTKKKKQSLGVIAPDRTGALVLLELAWGANLRKPPKAALLDGYASAPEEVTACVELIEAMAEPRAALDDLRDDAAVLRQQARALAEEGRLAEFAVPDGPSQSVDDPASLIEAMAASADAAEELVARA